MVDFADLTSEPGKFLKVLIALSKNGAGIREINSDLDKKLAIKGGPSLKVIINKKNLTFDTPSYNMRFYSFVPGSLFLLMGTTPTEAIPMQSCLSQLDNTSTVPAEFAQLMCNNQHTALELAQLHAEAPALKDL